MPLINCKIKLNLTWKKECALSTNDDDAANPENNAVFIINDTKLYVPVVTLSKEDNKYFIEQQNKGTNIMNTQMLIMLIVSGTLI